jgi:hypothetical protein
MFVKKKRSLALTITWYCTWCCQIIHVLCMGIFCMFMHVIFLSEESRMRALHVGCGKYWVRAKIGGVNDNAHTIAKLLRSLYNISSLPIKSSNANNISKSFYSELQFSWWGTLFYFIFPKSCEV